MPTTLSTSFDSSSPSIHVSSISTRVSIIPHIVLPRFRSRSSTRVGDIPRLSRFLRNAPSSSHNLARLSACARVLTCHLVFIRPARFLVAENSGYAFFILSAYFCRLFLLFRSDLCLLCFSRVGFTTTYHGASRSHPDSIESGNS